MDRFVQPRQSHWLSKLLYTVKELLLAIAIVMVGRTALAEGYYVPSGSMQPTLAIGDHLLVAKYPYGYSRYSLPVIPALLPPEKDRVLGKLPSRGDVVVFRFPRDPSMTFVKRVIGLPGDRVQMQAGRLVLNGEVLPLRAAGKGQMESENGIAVSAPRFIETLPGGKDHPIYKLQWNGPVDDTAVYVVPAGHLFVMGDNRDDSLDSRYPPDQGGVGFVPMENLVGEVDAVIASWDMNVPVSEPWRWPAAIRFSRFFTSVE